MHQSGAVSFWAWVRGYRVFVTFLLEADKVRRVKIPPTLPIFCKGEGEWVVHALAGPVVLPHWVWGGLALA